MTDSEIVLKVILPIVKPGNLKSIPDKAMELYFSQIRAPPTSLIRQEINAENFEKFLGTHPPYELSSYYYGDDDYDSITDWVNKKWSKIQLHNYLVKLMKLTGMNLYQMKKLGWTEDLMKNARRNKYKNIIDYNIRIRTYALYVDSIIYLQNAKKAMKSFGKLKHGLYKPGMRLSSNMEDSMNQEFETSKIENLLHCKNIDYKQAVELFNFMMTWISSDMQNKIMNHLVSEYSDKYNIVLDENKTLTYAETKKITKRIIMRITKYDFCQMMKDVGLEKWFISTINMKVGSSGAGAGAGAGAV